ncbi:MAG TPA: VOC family protein [Acidimicrobiales bacterium]|nr:VOC family protein [Acidimicrobiales bacterium]
MPTRHSAPTGSPCWVDLWTSDVEGSRTFYSELFGWEAQEPSPEFGGYFMFTRDGVPVAGAMGDMGDMAANDTWKVYLHTDDVAKTLEAAVAEGAQVVAPAMPVADLGTQAVLIDPTGADLGAWQPGTFPGFTVLNEHGAPSWFELHTRDHATAVAFYRSVFGWDTDTVGDSDEFRYTTMRDPSGDGELAGIMDASAFLPEGAPAHWSVYWEVDDSDRTVAKVKALGGSVVMDAVDTPYGRLATVADPAGAQFKLRRPPNP